MIVDDHDYDGVQGDDPVYHLLVVDGQSSMRVSSQVGNKRQQLFRYPFEFHTKKLSLLPANCRSNSHLGITFIAQDQGQFITDVEWEVADHAGSNA